MSLQFAPSSVERKTRVSGAVPLLVVAKSWLAVVPS
jgi:hypothetical protein